MQWFWLLVLIPLGLYFRKCWRQAQADALLLIESVMKNSKTNLGYEPDAASLSFLAKHPFLCAKLWRMLGEGGANSMAGGSTSEECQNACDELVKYVRNDEFRARCPCAAALIQYAIYLCDNTPTKEYGCEHPKDEMNRTHDNTR